MRFLAWCHFDGKTMDTCFSLQQKLVQNKLASLAKVSAVLSSPMFKPNVFGASIV